MILRVFLLAAIGLAASVPAALVASKLVKSYLFGMKPNDPLALTGAVVILTVARHSPVPALISWDPWRLLIRAKALCARQPFVCTDRGLVNNSAFR
jgi:hypothetical protein